MKGFNEKSHCGSVKGGVIKVDNSSEDSEEDNE